MYARGRLLAHLGEGRDGRHPAGHGDGRRQLEATRITGLAQEARRRQRTDAADGREGRVLTCEGDVEAALGLSDLGSERLETSQAQLGELDRNTAERCEQAPRGRELVACLRSPGRPSCAP